MLMSAITTSVYYITASRTTTATPATTGATTIMTTTVNTSCVYSHYHNTPVILDTCVTDLGPTRCTCPRLQQAVRKYSLQTTVPRLEHTCFDVAGTATFVPSATVSSGTTPGDNVLMRGPGSTRSPTILQTRYCSCNSVNPLLIPPSHILLRTPVLTTGIHSIQQLTGTAC